MLFPTVPLAIVTVVPLGVYVAVKDPILKIAACPVVPCGLVFGKFFSLEIVLNPPTSSTRSIILALWLLL